MRRPAALVLGIVLTFCPPIVAQSIIEDSGAVPEFDLRGRSIAVVMADGVEFNEASVVPDYWKRWGARIVYVGTASTLEAEEMVVNERGFIPLRRTFDAEIPLEKFDASAVDAIYFPGGESPRALLGQRRAEIIDLVQAADRRGTVLAAFCHGPAVLLAAGVARGKNIAAELPADTVREAGAVPVNAPHATDGNLVTGNFPYLESFAVEVARRLTGLPPSAAQGSFDALQFRIGLTEHFSDREVPDDLLRRVVQAAMLTAYDFSMNLHKPWSVVAVKDRALRERIGAALKQQFNAFYAARGVPEARRAAFLDAHVSAPVYAFVVMKKKIIDPRIGAWDSDPAIVLRHLTLAAGAFTNNLRVAAAQSGLGSNMAQGLPFLLAEPRLADVIDLAPDTFIAALVFLGFPAQAGLPQPLRPAGEQLAIR